MPRQDAPANLDRLTQIRILFFANAAWWVLALPFVFLVSADTDATALAISAALAATTGVGTVGVLLVPAVSERAPLRVESPEALVRSYFTRYILRIGFVDLPVTVGVAGWIITGAPLVYLVGIPFTLLAAARVAPTRHRIAIDQQEITDKGSSLALRELLDRPARTAP